jgi:hypothetical protein
MTGGLLAVVWPTAVAKPHRDRPAQFLANTPIVSGLTMHPAKDLLLAGTSEVVGVSVSGRHRAYLLEALIPFKNHVVNDLLGQVPITVTYCDMQDEVQVFTGKHPGNALDLAVGGFLTPEDDSHGTGCMLLRHANHFYRQDNTESADEHAPVFPYSKAACQRTTWESWLAAHPDTDIYLGPFQQRSEYWRKSAESAKLGGQAK